MKVLLIVGLCVYSIGNLAAAMSPCVSTTTLPPNTTMPPPANFSLYENYEREAIFNGILANFSIDVGRAGGRGRALSNYDCRVVRLPDKVRRNMRLNRFYTKYAHAYGIPIISSGNVADAAIRRACYVVRFALADRKDIRDWLHDRYGRAGIIGERERTTDIPEHSYLPNWWNQRARGLGATLAQPISTAGEENILCRSSDRYYGGGRGEDIFLHEFAHAIHNLGVTGAIPYFDTNIRRLYNKRKRDGRWARTYYMSTDREFFAEGVTSYFDVNTETYNGRPNGIHNHVNTRKELKKYDYELYKLVESVFPCGNIFLDRCSAKAGVKHKPFRMNCGKGATAFTRNQATTAAQGGATQKPPRPTTVKKGGGVVTPRPTTGCVDLNPKCKQWVKYCTGNQHQAYMKKNCRQTCSRQVDGSRHCNYWAKQTGKNYCSTHPYVKKYCKKSCGIC